MDFLQQTLQKRYLKENTPEPVSVSKTVKKGRGPDQKKVLIDKLNYALEQAERPNNDRADAIRKVVMMLENNQNIQSLIDFIKTPEKPNMAKIEKAGKNKMWIGNHLLKTK